MRNRWFALCSRTLGGEPSDHAGIIKDFPLEAVDCNADCKNRHRLQQFGCESAGQRRSASRSNVAMSASPNAESAAITLGASGLRSRRSALRAVSHGARAQHAALGLYEALQAFTNRTAALVTLLGVFSRRPPALR